MENNNSTIKCVKGKDGKLYYSQNGKRIKAPPKNICDDIAISVSSLTIRSKKEKVPRPKEEEKWSFKIGFISKIDRTYLREELEKYWVNKNESNIGVGPLEIDWNTRLINSYRWLIFRKDIFHISYKYKNEEDSVFVEPDLYFSSVPKEIRNEFSEFIKTLPNKYKEFYSKQYKWYKEYPEIQEKINNKTPEEAVEILKQYGY